MVSPARATWGGPQWRRSWRHLRGDAEPGGGEESLTSLSNRAEQGFAGDGEQRPLVPRSHCSPHLTPGVRHSKQRRRDVFSIIHHRP
jgi:hypothetical protein